MTTKEILNQLAAANFSVECDHDITYATSRIGTIQELKFFGKNAGVGVLFPGMKWNTWFFDTEETDARRRYTRQLIIAPNVAGSDTTDDASKDEAKLEK